MHDAYGNNCACQINQQAHSNNKTDKQKTIKIVSGMGFFFDITGIPT